ncbi:MAG: M20/M25/M40 family metallo-hydrolase [Anaerolineales bacterium]|nr:M20/M25/M40 family metallo-hydrolase [Anaerolineales bacterium]
MAAANETVNVLDANAAGKVYYLVDASAEGAADAARPVGEVIDVVGGVLIVATTPANEVALVDHLGVNGVQVSLLTAAALAPPGSARDAAFAPAAVAAVPNPAIAALLPKLTEADLRTLVDRLSGQTPATIGGVAITLNTRHTLTARVHDAEQYVYEYYQALGIPVSYFNWTYGSYSGRNVVAEVRGTANPEKVLLVGGHLDNMSQIPYTTAPGADDNATGTANTLLIARLLKANQPAVTVRFIHFTGEEQGQWGSKVYAATLRARGEQVMGFINLDMIGWDGNGDRVVEIHTASGPKSNALADGYLERNTRYGTGLVFERKTTTASRFSDHSPFWDNDYASFLVIENFFDDAIVRDRNPYYHNTGDLPSRVDYNYVARIGRLTLAVLAELAGYNFGGSPTPPPTKTPVSCPNLLVSGHFENNGGGVLAPHPILVDTCLVLFTMACVRYGLASRTG